MNNDLHQCDNSSDFPLIEDSYV